MNWLKLISQVLLQFSVQQRQLQAAPEKIKGMTVQAGVYFVGLIFLIAFTLASTIMVFVNLGKQWDSDTPAHFNGTITAAFLLFLLGVIAFGISALLARHLARKKAVSMPAEVPTQTASPDLNPLLIFGEEFVKQLLGKLK